jgi:hypothetical protein
MKRYQWLSFFWIVGGLIVTMVGYAMWRSPHVNFENFLQFTIELCSSIIKEVIRMASDPFSIIGFFVMLTGLSILLIGFLKLIMT